MYNMYNSLFSHTHTLFLTQVVFLLGIHEPHATRETRREKVGETKEMADLQEEDACPVPSKTSGI